MGMLDRQAPDVKIIADANNDIHNKASIHTNCGAKHEEHKGGLIDIVAQRAGPANTVVVQQDRANGINNTKADEHAEDVPVGETHLGKVSSDHLPDAVGINEAGEEGKGNQVVVEDIWLQIQIRNDKGPDSEERNKAKQGTSGTVTAGTASSDDVDGRLESVEAGHNGALNHVPLGKGELVDELGNAQRRGNTNGAQGALLPDVRASHETGQREDRGNNEHALNGSIDNAKSKSLGVVLVPGLDVKGKESWSPRLASDCSSSDSPCRFEWDSWRGSGRGAEKKSLTSKKSGHSLPALSHVLGCGKDEDLQSRV